MALTPGAGPKTIIALRKLGYRVGIVTDSYTVAAEVIRRRVFADFCIGKRIDFRDGRTTGEVTPSPLMFPSGRVSHSSAMQTKRDAEPDGSDGTRRRPSPRGRRRRERHLHASGRRSFHCLRAENAPRSVTPPRSSCTVRCMTHYP